MVEEEKGKEQKQERWRVEELELVRRGRLKVWGYSKGWHETGKN